MGKYDPLSARLKDEASDRWEASFAEVEEVLGASLPKSARERESWWTQEPEAVHGRSWGEAGWTVARVDLTAERVTFAREGAEAAEPTTPNLPVVVKPRRSLGLNPAWIGGALVGVAGVAGTLAAVWMRRRR
jgi:hypothetical protein